MLGRPPRGPLTLVKASPGWADKLGAWTRACLHASSTKSQTCALPIHKSPTAAPRSRAGKRAASGATRWGWTSGCPSAKPYSAAPRSRAPIRPCARHSTRRRATWQGFADMLCLEDCLALCGLTEEEVLAIAQHERIPEIAAAEMGNYLVRTPEGEMCIKEIIRDDIARAHARGDSDCELCLKAVLRNYVLGHPRCEERHRRQLHAVERRCECA